MGQLFTLACPATRWAHTASSNSTPHGARRRLWRSMNVLCAIGQARKEASAGALSAGRRVVGQVGKTTSLGVAAAGRDCVAFTLEYRLWYGVMCDRVIGVQTRQPSVMGSRRWKLPPATGQAHAQAPRTRLGPIQSSARAGITDQGPSLLCHRAALGMHHC